MSDCNADLGHPCDAGGRDDDDQAIPCESCQETERRFQAFGRAYAGQFRSTDQELRDAGRGHLLP